MRLLLLSSLRWTRLQAPTSCQSFCSVVFRLYSVDAAAAAPTLATTPAPKNAANPSGKRKQKTYPTLPEIPEEDIEEKYVRGTGPGGQKINKTSIVAQLKHIPTGIQVSCQETRSLQQNRSIGRKRLREKVDAHLNGDASRVMTKARESIRKKKSADKKKSKKYKLLDMAKASASTQEVD